MTINPLLKRINNGQVLTLDGAVGTEIEKLHIIQHPQLWSSDALVNHPEVIERIHQRYLAAGADIIETATYQANPHFLDAQGVDGATLVDRAINLARTAVATSHRAIRPLIAGSLGPYGCSLNDGSEYTGKYHRSYQEFQDYHAASLDLFAGRVDFLAVETIPHFGEIQALVDLLESRGLFGWVSLSLNDHQDLADGTPLKAVVSFLNQSPAVLAIGANCMNINQATASVRKIAALTFKPVVIYPNNGDVFDKARGEWQVVPGAPQFSDLVPEWIAAGARIIGGCCRVTPADIAAIHQACLIK